MKEEHWSTKGRISSQHAASRVPLMTPIGYQEPWTYTRITWHQTGMAALETSNVHGQVIICDGGDGKA